MRRELTYLALDVLLERGEHGSYRARILDAPAGPSPATDFRVPFAPMEIENFLLRIGRPRQVVRRVDAPETAAVRDFGGRLYQALFRDQLEVGLLRSLSEATAKGAGLRIRLRLSDTPELAQLPWEFLYDPTRRHFLCLSDRTPLVRYLEVYDPPRPLVVEPPLRILVMIASPADRARLDVEREWATLREALAPLRDAGKVTIHRLPSGTLTALRRELRGHDWHVLHFIGHGGFDSQAQDGVLAVEDEHQRSRLVSGEDLGVLLHDHYPLRLVVLNSCEGARADATDPFAGTAQSLIQQGIPAVVAMQFEISDAAAITLAGELYASVAAGYPLDAALAQARQAIWTDGNKVEWATPVLHLRAPDSRIFEVRQHPAVIEGQPAGGTSGGGHEPAATVAPDAVEAPVPDATGTAQPRPAHAGTRPTDADRSTRSAWLRNVDEARSEAGDPSADAGLAGALEKLARFDRDHGLLDEATGEYLEAKEIVTRLNMPKWQLRIDRQIAVLQGDIGKYDEMLAQLKTISEQSFAAEDVFNYVVSGLRAALLVLGDENTSEAERYRDARSRFSAISSELDRTVDATDGGHAFVRLRDALGTGQEDELRRSYVAVVDHLISLASRLEPPGSAMQLLEDRLSLPFEDAGQAAGALRQLGRQYIALGDSMQAGADPAPHAQAFAFYEAAVEVFEKFGDDIELRGALRRCCEIQLLSGNHALAEEYSERRSMIGTRERETRTAVQPASWPYHLLEIAAVALPESAVDDRAVRIAVDLRNAGSLTWLERRDLTVEYGLAWKNTRHSTSGTVALSRNLRPGQSATVTLDFPLPESAEGPVHAFARVEGRGWQADGPTVESEPRTFTMPR